MFMASVDFILTFIYDPKLSLLTKVIFTTITVLFDLIAVFLPYRMHQPIFQFFCNLADRSANREYWFAMFRITAMWVHQDFDHFVKDLNTIRK